MIWKTAGNLLVLLTLEVDKWQFSKASSWFCRKSLTVVMAVTSLKSWAINNENVKENYAQHSMHI